MKRREFLKTTATKGAPALFALWSLMDSSGCTREKKNKTNPNAPRYTLTIGGNRVTDTPDGLRKTWQDMRNKHISKYISDDYLKLCDSIDAFVGEMMIDDQWFSRKRSFKKIEDIPGKRVTYFVSTWLMERTALLAQRNSYYRLSISLDYHQNEDKKDILDKVHEYRITRILGDEKGNKIIWQLLGSTEKEMFNCYMVGPGPVSYRAPGPLEIVYREAQLPDGTFGSPAYEVDIIRQARAKFLNAVKNQDVVKNRFMLPNLEDRIYNLSRVTGKQNFIQTQLFL